MKNLMCNIIFIIFSFSISLVAERYMSGATSGTFWAFSNVSKGADNIVHFSTSNIPWYANSNGAGDGLTFNQTQTAISAAYTSWTNVSTCDLSFTYQGSTSATWGNDGMNVHYWAESGDPAWNSGNPWDKIHLHQELLLLL